VRGIQRAASAERGDDGRAGPAIPQESTHHHGRAPFEHSQAISSPSPRPA
jgi:hypothetical protein